MGVVADDLTGAADTAVHFVRPGEEILLVPLAGVAVGLTAAPGTAGLAIDTGNAGIESHGDGPQDAEGRRPDPSRSNPP